MRRAISMSVIGFSVGLLSLLAAGGLGLSALERLDQAEHGPLVRAITLQGIAKVAAHHGPDRRHLDDLLTFAHGHGTIGLLQHDLASSLHGAIARPSSRVAALTFAEARVQRWLAVSDLVAARRRGRSPRFAHQAASSRSALLDRASRSSAISSKLLPFIAS